MKIKSLDLAVFLQKITVYEAYKSYLNMIEEFPETKNWSIEFFGQDFRKLNSMLIKANRFTEADELLYIIKSNEIADFTNRSINYLNDKYIPELNKNEKLLFNEYLNLDSTKDYKIYDDQVYSDSELRKQSKEFNDFLVKSKNLFLKTRGSGIKFQDKILENEITPKKSIERLKIVQSKLANSKKKSSIVRYFVDSEFINIIVTTASTQKHFQKKIKKNELSKLIQKYRFSIINFKDDYKLKSLELYKILFKEIDIFLQKEEISEIYLALDQKLRYLPFSSLIDGKKYLIEKYNISIYPENSNQDFFDKSKSIDFFAGLGLTKSISGYDALPNVKKEINDIHFTFNDKNSNAIFIDDSFTDENFWDSLNRDFPAVHIATHFNLNPINLNKSFLILGNGNKLYIKDLKKLHDNNINHEIILLSACDTAKGGSSFEDGREIDSLADLFLRSGSKTVIASLWKIADASTPVFMLNFYKQLADSSSKTSSLAYSMKEMIKSKKFNHPFFWSSFILLGNPL